MRMTKASGIVVLSAVAVMLAFPASATPRTYYDTQAKKWVTYDPDKVLLGARAEGTAVQGKAVVQHRQPDKKFDRQEVFYRSDEAPGTIIIDTKKKFLYLVQDGSRALRMGVGVGREGFGWSGVVHVGAKQENPKWFPPAEMVERQPELAKYQADGMPGGEGNPLGVRALYLYDDKGKDTLYRIHGTIEPWSIGLNVSSGCIRMLNENVSALYDMVEVGTKVIVM